MIKILKLNLFHRLISILKELIEIILKEDLNI